MNFLCLLTNEQSTICSYREKLAIDEGFVRVLQDSYSWDSLSICLEQEAKVVKYQNCVKQTGKASDLRPNIVKFTDDWSKVFSAIFAVGSTNRPCSRLSLVEGAFVQLGDYMTNFHTDLGGGFNISSPDLHAIKVFFFTFIRFILLSFYNCFVQGLVCVSPFLEYSTRFYACSEGDG